MTDTIPSQSTAAPQIISEPKQEGEGLVDKAYKAAEKLEAANKKTEELIQRQEALIAKQMLGGRAQAGTIIKTQSETEAEQIQSEAKRIASLFK